MMLVKRAPPRQDIGGSSDTGGAQDEENAGMPPSCNSESLINKANQIVEFVEVALENRTAAHEVEGGLWWRVPKIGGEYRASTGGA
jgi:hypothetical protein